MFEWQICHTEMTNLLQFTVNVRKSHRKPQCTLQLVCEDRMIFKIFLRYFMWEAAFKMEASNSSPLFTFILQK